MSEQPFISHLFGFRPVKNESRYAWVDYAKGIAIILVVYRHLAYGLLASHVALPTSVTSLNDMLYSFRMPLFFLLSGFFFSRSIQKRGPKHFAISKVNTLLYPYLLWAVFQISLQIVFSGYTNSVRTVKDYANIFLQPRTLDQLWYLFALFNVTILYLLASLMVREKKAWQLVIGMVLLGIAPYVQHISAWYDIALHYIFFAVGDITAAFFLRDNVQQKLSDLRNLLLMLPVFAVLQWYYLHHQHMNLYLFMLIALNGCLFIISLASWLAHTGKMKFLNVIGHYSLYIYLLHVTIAAVLRALLLYAGVSNGVVLLLVTIPASIYLSIIVYRACTYWGLGFLFAGKFGEKTAVKAA
ncbi:MAG TPA: acyltransferase [Chitinophaga sp.]|uniref:acyltransferase n=1 Tax=Chitinophaga sp. TaxID=1869181 RepID=UPI002C678A4A|nr:acyltransferase [Chitinophaga sp.]HVI48682.1 acyltransferase [Chitinophaga sp.]